MMHYERLLNWLRDLSVEWRCYTIGFDILVVATILTPFKGPEAVALSQLGALVFTFGLMTLIERLYEWAWQRLIGKLIIAALITLATNIAYGYGRQIVAELIGTNPAPFASIPGLAVQDGQKRK